MAPEGQIVIFTALCFLQWSRECICMRAADSVLGTVASRPLQASDCSGL